MFSNLTDFSFKRSAIQAVGFYIAYLVLTIVLGALAGGVFSILTSDLTVAGSYLSGVRIGAVLAVVVSTSLAFVVVSKKQRLSNFFYLILIALSGILALLAGGLAGLIIPAFLTTRDSLTTEGSKPTAATAVPQPANLENTPTPTIEKPNSL